MDRKTEKNALHVERYSKRHKEYLTQQNEAVRQTIEAGYHCGWTMDEIMHTVRSIGSTLSRDEVSAMYTALHVSIDAQQV